MLGYPNGIDLLIQCIGLRSLYEFYYDCMGPHPVKIHLDYEEHPEDEDESVSMLTGWAELCMDKASNYIGTHWNLPGWLHEDGTPF